MAKIKLRNIGPIKDGLLNSDEFIDLSGLVVFIGNQGTGKSTIAKLFSTLSWIEKALVRGDFTSQYIEQYNRFKNRYLAYQNISGYLNDNSYFEYQGDACEFTFQNNQFRVNKVASNNNYNYPKIMYVPAERNFVSSIDRPDLIKRLPLPLYTFMDEYEAAKQNLKENIVLPIGSVKFEYKKNSKKSYLVGNDFKIELLEASSGFQSATPLILVTRHLSEVIKNKVSDTRKELNRDSEERLRKAVFDLLKDHKITEDVFKATLENLSARFSYNCFINVVEEPEQNLFPLSQKDVLFDLIKYLNEHEGNKLILTTHSPYIINFLSIAIQAHYLKEKITINKNPEKKKKLHDRLNNIVPSDSTINIKCVNIYQIDEGGNINKLDSIHGIPSDKNYLNRQLRFGNELFDSLLEIEEELD